MSILKIRNQQGEFVDIPAIVGPQGEQGETGATGADGYTPVKGTDYWTDEDKEEIKADISAEVAEQLADKAQLVPEFANDVSECIDTSKLYVLPDGYIYAYMTKTETHIPTNQVPISIDSDGTLYNNGQGWKTGYRIKDGDGTEYALSGSEVTGFIPITRSDTFRAKNFTKSDNSYNLIAFYDSSFAFVKPFTGSSSYNPLSQFVQDDGTLAGCLDNLTTSNITETQLNSVAYMRLSFSVIDNTTVVTVNESLESTEITTQGWYSTGHAFVPTDYEGRIIDLEDRATSLESRINELSVGESGTITYVAEEANRVANIVQAKRTVGSLTFTAMSDFHVEVDTEITYGVKNNLTSCRDAGLGLLELQKHLKLDFAAVLGDYTWGDDAETIEQVKKDHTYVKKCMTNGMKGIPNIWCTGNHDINYGANTDRRMTEDELYAYITSNNTCTVQDGDNIGRNYGYIDFENQKIRCVYLNTVDSLDYPDNTDGTADDALEITATQAQWLVDVGLDFSSKSNPTEWGIITFSHHCLCQFPVVTAILTAYKDGASGSMSVTTNGITTAVNYDFASVNRGEIICAIHGHDHNFTYRKISDELWYQVTEENAWLWSICIPNVDTTRNNEKATNSDDAYKQAFGEFDANGDPVYYPKEQGTAASTSFCVMVIDRQNRKIHATAYGAGIDREISY